MTKNKKNNFSGGLTLKIAAQIKPWGYLLNFLNRKYQIKYPAKIFSCLSPETKRCLADNYFYCRARLLSLINNRQLSFSTAKPFLQQFIDFGIINDLDFISDSSQRTKKRLLNNFFKNSIDDDYFAGRQINKLTPPQPTNDQRALIASSFGKESLLSYGLAKEIGLKTSLIYVKEMPDRYVQENAVKTQIIKKFCSEQREKIYFLTDDIDEIFHHPRLKNKIDNLDNPNSMLSFVLDLVPYAFKFQTKYIILGNERNFDDYYLNQQGEKVYYSFDQSSLYTKKLNFNLAKLTNNNLTVASLVQPIYNLAEMQILKNRYPYLLKYLMSCNLGVAAKDKWCYHCMLCATVYLFACAVGLDPKNIGFKQNMFNKNKGDLYFVFDRSLLKTYFSPQQARDEQLLAFLLAYRHGFKGQLISQFQKKFLKKALQKEKQLRKKFFAIYKTPSLPLELNRQLNKIFRGELANYL